MICCMSDLIRLDNLLFAEFVRCKGEDETTVTVNSPFSSKTLNFWKTATTLCSPQSSVGENIWHVGQTF